MKLDPTLIFLHPLPRRRGTGGARELYVTYAGLRVPGQFERLEGPLRTPRDIVQAGLLIDAWVERMSAHEKLEVIVRTKVIIAK